MKSTALVFLCGLGLYAVALGIRLIADLTAIWVLPLLTPPLALGLALVGLYRLGLADENRRAWSREGFSARMRDRTAVWVAVVILAEVFIVFTAGSVFSQAWWATTIVLLPVLVIGIIDIRRLPPVDDAAHGGARIAIAKALRMVGIQEDARLRVNGSAVVLTLTPAIRDADDSGAAEEAFEAVGYEVIERGFTSLTLSEIRYAGETDDDRPLPVERPSWGGDV